MNRKELDNLLLRIAKGDNAAFEKLYVSTNKGVFAFLRTYLHNDADVEDAMQTVYLKIKTGILSYRVGTNGSAWILQIAKNHALNELKKRKNVVSLQDVEYTLSTDEPHVPFGITDVMERVLTEEEQRIITMHVLWRYKHREIAQTLEKPTGTITSTYKRAIEKLKKALKEENI